VAVPGNFLGLLGERLNVAAAAIFCDVVADTDVSPSISTLRA
jgi:hypothetical protein